MKTEREAGEKLAQIGGDIYVLADQFPAIENFEDYRRIMFLLNKLAFRMIQGRERDEPELGERASSVDAKRPRR